MVFHRMLGILLGVEHPKPKEEQSNRNDKSDPEAHPPNSTIKLLPVRRKDDRHDNPSSNESRVDGKASRQG